VPSHKLLPIRTQQLSLTRNNSARGSLRCTHASTSWFYCRDACVLAVSRHRRVGETSAEAELGGLCGPQSGGGFLTRVTHQKLVSKRRPVFTVTLPLPTICAGPRINEQVR
jgi:hypothetical protein